MDDLRRDLSEEGTELAVVMSNYGVPDPAPSFALNELCPEAAASDGRIRAGIWRRRAQDAVETDKALALAGEPEVRVIKIIFLLGGGAADPECVPQLDRVFATAREHDLTVHVHTSPGGASDIDQVGHLVERYADDVRLHLVRLGGGMSGHIKLVGGRFFDWISAGKQVYTDTSWAVGFAPRWLATEIERRGVGADRVLFVSDEPWADRAGELARPTAVTGDGEMARMIMRGNAEALHG